MDSKIEFRSGLVLGVALLCFAGCGEPKDGAAETDATEDGDTDSGDSTSEDSSDGTTEDTDESEVDSTDTTEDTTDESEVDSTDATETGMGDPEALEAMTGIYLFALETSLGPDTPLQFVTTVDVTAAPNGLSATADFVFQPLSLDVGETTTPREFVGTPLEYNDVAVDADGNYEIDMGLVFVTGEANPVTGSDIEAILQVLGTKVHDNAMCGTIEGELTEPLEFDLAGSTFAAIRLDDDGSNPQTLPVEFPYSCDAVPPE